MKSNQDHSREQQERHWQEILSLSVKMREFAEKRDWPSLQNAMEKRETLLPLYFNENTSAPKVTEKIERIGILQKIDKTVLELTNKNKGLLTNEIVRLQKGKNGLAAYAAGQSEPSA
ncbi:MAG: hypothetical protein V4751_10590 [Pseudomonadota bacterium]